MPQTDSILTPTQARARLLTIAVAILLLVVAAAGFLSARSHGRSSAATGHAVSAGTGTPSSQPATPAPSVAAAQPNIGPLAVLTGRELVNGVYLGFPHTVQGAVSAADGFMTQYLSTLDPDRAAAIARLAADSSFTNAANTLAASVGTERQALGLPSTGSVPPNYALATTCAEYQLRDQEPDHLTVLLLADVTTSNPASGTSTNIAVITIAVHWDGADWKLLSPPDGTPYLRLGATPDTAQAAALGWADLQTG